MTKKQPFDFKASLDMPNWHQDFISIIDEKEFLNFLEQQNKSIITYLQSMQNNEKKDVFLLSLPTLKERFNSLIISVMAVQNANNRDIDLISSLGEVNFLKTGDKKYLKQKTKQLLIEKSLKTYFLRRIIRTLTWTKWWQLPLTIFNPDIIAVGHNEIVRQKAKSSNKRVYFYQSSELLIKINKNKVNYKKPEYFDNLCKETYDTFIANFKIQEQYLERFKYLVYEYIEEYLTRDIKALKQCYQYDKLPKNIWIGTGNAYSFRLLALAVLRKGGSVTSFAHACWTVLMPNYSYFYFGEFAVTNEFVDITTASKNNFYNEYLKLFLTPLNSPFAISTLKKNTALVKYTDKTIKSSKKRPTVVYTSNAIRCSSIVEPMADCMAYLKWQLELTNILDKMDIDLICQPHPEGIFIDKKLIHPLRKKYNTPYRSFEEIMQEADIFLVDFIHSTTFGEMLVTNKPIVRIGWYDDNKFYGIADRIKSIMDKRCRTIKAEFDENNLPVVDKQQLEVALTHNWQEKVDATEFRELLIG